MHIMPPVLFAIDVPLVMSALVAAGALLAAVLVVLRTARASRMGSMHHPDPLIVFPRNENRPVAAGPPRAPQPVAAADEPFSGRPTLVPDSPAPVPDEPRLVEGHTIRFYRPPEGTLQLLPGRLEVVGGEDRGQDIRFVRFVGESPRITFGRKEGPPGRHIQLYAPTVSREHAEMRLDGNGWQIANLSQTNPLVVNGDELSHGDGARALEDGDRIEMGEVVFQFREH